jgi:hypothetical protein
VKVRLCKLLGVRPSAAELLVCWLRCVLLCVFGCMLVWRTVADSCKTPSGESRHVPSGAEAAAFQVARTRPAARADPEALPSCLGGSQRPPASLLRRRGGLSRCGSTKGVICVLAGVAFVLPSFAPSLSVAPMPSLHPIPRRQDGCLGCGQPLPGRRWSGPQAWPAVPGRVAFSDPPAPFCGNFAGDPHGPACVDPPRLAVPSARPQGRAATARRLLGPVGAPCVTQRARPRVRACWLLSQCRRDILRVRGLCRAVIL